MDSSYIILTLFQVSFLGFISYQVYSERGVLFKRSQSELDLKNLEPELENIVGQPLPEEFYIQAEGVIDSEIARLNERKRVIHQLKSGFLDEPFIIDTDIKEMIVSGERHLTKDTEELFVKIDNYIFNQNNVLDPTNESIRERLQ